MYLLPIHRGSARRLAIQSSARLQCLQLTIRWVRSYLIMGITSYTLDFRVPANCLLTHMRQCDGKQSRIKPILFRIMLFARNLRYRCSHTIPSWELGHLLVHGVGVTPTHPTHPTCQGSGFAPGVWFSCVSMRKWALYQRTYGPYKYFGDIPHGSTLKTLEASLSRLRVQRLRNWMGIEQRFARAYDRGAHRTELRSDLK